MGVRNYGGIGTLNTDAVRIAFNENLQRRAIPSSIYANLQVEQELWQDHEMAMPESVIVKATAKGLDVSATDMRFYMKPWINANPIRANGVAMGTEVPPTIKSGHAYRNNYRFVVQAPPGYGEHRLDAEHIQLYQNHTRDCTGPHAAAYTDLEIHMALVETHGWNLQAGSTINLCPAIWNRNVYVAGVTVANQPVFSPVAATWTNRIVTSMQAAAGGAAANFAQTAGQMLSGQIMDNLVRFALGRNMWPLMIDGHQAFVLTISDLQAARFTNPNFTDTLGSRYTRVENMDVTEAEHWHGVLGRWRSTAGADIWCVRDDRLATLLPTGSAAPFGLQAGYMWPTDNDQRNLTNPLVRDASILHGKGALILREPEPIHFIDQDWDYGVRNGYGYAGVRGYQQLQFDTTPVDPTGVQREYYGSALVILGRSETQ